MQICIAMKFSAEDEWAVGGGGWGFLRLQTWGSMDIASWHVVGVVCVCLGLQLMAYGLNAGFAGQLVDHGHELIQSHIG